MIKRRFLIFLLISLTGFFVWPKITLADVQLSDYEVNLLLDSIQEQPLFEKYTNLLSSSNESLGPEKQVATMLIRKAIQQKEFQYILIDVSKEYLIKLLKLGAKLLVSENIPLVILDEIEKKSVEKAVEITTNWLQQNEIKVAAGTLNYSFKSYRGNQQNPVFYYNLAYRPLTNTFGELAVEFYSPKVFEPLASKGNSIVRDTYWEIESWRAAGNEKLKPFIIKIKGRAEKEKEGGYTLDNAKVEVTFSEPVPELKPEKKEEPVTILDKIKQGAEKLQQVVQKIQEIYSWIKDIFPEVELLGGQIASLENKTSIPTGTLEPLTIQEAEGIISKIEEVLNKEEETKEEKEIPAEAGPPPPPSELQSPDLEEIQEILDDISERVDIVNQEVIGIVQISEGEINLEEPTPESLAQAPIESDSEEIALETQEPENQEAEPQELIPQESEIVEAVLVGSFPDTTLPRILISEVCAGWDKAGNEFIELYNPNDQDIFLEDYNFKLKLVSSSNKVTEKRIDELPKTIPAKSYFLLVGGEIEGISADVTFASQLSSTSGVIISDGQDNIKDSLSWGTSEKPPPSGAIEGTGIILGDGLKTGKSLERIKIGDNLIDTDDNYQDFIFNNNPSPTNSLGQIIYLPPEEEPAPPPPPPEPEPEPPPVPPLPSEPANHILINEIQIDSIDGAGGADDDWVELYNPTNQDISLAGWSIQEHSKSDPCSTQSGFYRKKFPETAVISAQGYYLVVDTQANENLKMIADLTAAWLLTDNNTIYLVGNEDSIEGGDDPNIIDKIALGAVSCFPEGNPASDIPDAQSLQRKTLGIDTNDNSQDFVINETPSPTNSKGEAGPTFLTNFQIIEDATFSLSGSPYIIQNNLTVNEGKTLTVETGATLKFGQFGNLIINGTLKAIGQENKKITFTRLAEDGLWQGIYFSEKNSNSELTWVKVEYAETDPLQHGMPASILVENSSINFKNSTVENYPHRGLRLIYSSASLIENSNFFGPGKTDLNSLGIEIRGGASTIKTSFFKNNYYGIYVADFPEDKPLIEGNNFEENEYPIWALPQFVFLSNRGQNNTNNGILITGRMENENLTLLENPLPYIIWNSIEVLENRVLTIEPGVIVKFDSVSRLEIKGQLLAQGTPEKLITFTSSDNCPFCSGAWESIYFYPSSTGSILENVIVENGGRYSWLAFLFPMIQIDNTQVIFDNLTLRNSGRLGLFSKNSNSIIRNSHFTNNQIGIRIEGDIYPQITNCQIESNDWNIVWNSGGENCQNFQQEYPRVFCDCCQ